MNVLLTRVLVLALFVAVGAGQGRTADSTAATAPQEPATQKTLETLIEEIPWREYLGLRLWPLAATLAVGWFAGAIALAIAETDPARANVAVERYGRISAWSLDLAAAGVIALIVACVGLVGVLRASGKESPRWLYWHAVLVLVTLSALTLYLTANGVIPMVTWT